MSDILIRGMSMPKYTTKAEFGIDADGNPLCMVYHEDGTEPDIYDVVPLPKGHGRLIDAGSLYDRLENTLTHFIKVKSYTESQKYAFGYCEAWNDAKAVLTNAPTIVPAEGGGEDG